MAASSTLSTEVRTLILVGRTLELLGLAALFAFVTWAALGGVANGG